MSEQTTNAATASEPEEQGAAKPAKGKKPKAKLKLKATKKAKAAEPSANGHKPKHSLKPGTTFERVYKDKTYKVKVTDDGFECGGKKYSSLTSLAKFITSYPAISGPAFFAKQLEK